MCQTLLCADIWSLVDCKCDACLLHASHSFDNRPWSCRLVEGHSADTAPLANDWLLTVNGCSSRVFLMKDRWQLLSPSANSPPQRLQRARPIVAKAYGTQLFLGPCLKEQPIKASVLSKYMQRALLSRLYMKQTNRWLFDSLCLCNQHLANLRRLLGCRSYDFICVRSSSNVTEAVGGNNSPLR